MCAVRSFCGQGRIDQRFFYVRFAFMTYEFKVYDVFQDATRIAHVDRAHDVARIAYTARTCDAMHAQVYRVALLLPAFRYASLLEAALGGSFRGIQIGANFEKATRL